MSVYFSFIVPNSHTHRYQLFDDHFAIWFSFHCCPFLWPWRNCFWDDIVLQWPTRSWLRISKCDNNNMWFVLLHKTIKSCSLNTLPNLMKAIKQMMMRSIAFYDNFSFRLFSSFLCFSTHFVQLFVCDSIDIESTIYKIRPNSRGE